MDLSELREREDKLQGLGTSLLRKEDARFIQGKGNYDTAALAAEALQLLGTVGGGKDGYVVHSAASWKGTPASFAAAN